MKKKQYKSIKMLKDVLDKKEYIMEIFNKYDEIKFKEFAEKYPDASGGCPGSSGQCHINELEKIMKRFKKDLKNAKKK